jgi:hypothetical protein
MLFPCGTHAKAERRGLQAFPEERQVAHPKPSGVCVQVIISRLGSLLFNLHIAEFVGVEDFAAFSAFDIFGVFRAGDDSDSGMFAGARHVGSERFD